jgi:ABC-2 type transport system ATP-binding protein
MSEVILKVNEVYKHFKTVKAVDGIGFEVGKSEFVALLGPNGAGKTTLIEMVEGIQKPDKGEILLNGKHWAGNETELHKFIGISLQETHFFDKTTVKETLDVFSSFYGLSGSRGDEILEIIQLMDKRNAYVEKLSGGQRQKLALGIAMLNNAQLLLLDEPTTGLDPTARREIWNILLNLKQQHQTSMILTTHYMEEAEFLCDKIMIIDKGKMLAQGTLDQLLDQKGCYEIIEFAVNEPLLNLDFLDESGIQKKTCDTRLGSGKVLVFEIVSQLPVFLDKMKENGFTLKSLVCRKMTLDDLFVEMTGRRLDQ